MDLRRLSAAQLLAITEPELLFTGEEDAAKLEYRLLSKHWHPDRNPGLDGTVMAHINVLYAMAVKRLADNTWTINGQVTFNATNGKSFILRYLRRQEFELGEVYIGETVIGYAFHKDNDDLYTNMLQRIAGFKYANEKMKQEMQRFLPALQTPQSFFETDERFVVILSKPAGLLSLRDVLSHLGKLEPRHVAWITSSMLNVACYLRYAQLVNAGFTADAFLIDPYTHAGALYGGWWYTVGVNEQLKALSGAVVEQCADDILTKQRGDPRLDLDMIRATARELLGDINGSKLLMDKEIPKPLLTWLRTPSKGDALADYKSWNTVLEESFGPRRFVTLSVTQQEIYR